MQLPVDLSGIKIKLVEERRFNINEYDVTGMLKVLDSAAANAEYKNISKSDLFVAEAFADQGPTLKRIMPRAKGRAYRILKRTSHITVIMDSSIK